ncbi:MAG: hypothetical protein Q9188_003237 [Gyalolechia gomerana]
MHKTDEPLGIYLDEEGLPVLPNGNADEGICEEIAEPPKGDEDPYGPGPETEFWCYENTLIED